MKNGTIDILDDMENIFHMVDTIKTDFTKCGNNLREAGRHFNIKVFEHSNKSVKCIYGLQKKTLQEHSSKGDKALKIDRLDYFSKGKTVLIYNIKNNVYEFNRIKDVSGNVLIFSKGLQNDYPKSSKIVAIKQVFYKLYSTRNLLKRKVDHIRFKPLAKNVTDLSITHFDESQNVFYRIEVNRNVQIRGHIFLTSMV